MTESTATDWQQAREALGPEAALPLPGYLARGLAFAVDLAVMVMVVGMLDLVIGLVLTVLAAAELIPSVRDAGVRPAKEVFEYPVVVAAGNVVLGLALAYMPWFWARGGQTPAMSFLGMRVTRGDTNAEVGFRVAIVRFLALVVSIVSVVGILWVFVDPRRRGWHDIVAGTLVIAE